MLLTKRPGRSFHVCISRRCSHHGTSIQLLQWLHSSSAGHLVLAACGAGQCTLNTLPMLLGTLGLTVAIAHASLPLSSCAGRQGVTAAKQAAAANGKEQQQLPPSVLVQTCGHSSKVLVGVGGIIQQTDKGRQQPQRQQQQNMLGTSSHSSSIKNSTTPSRGACQ